MPELKLNIHTETAISKFKWNNQVENVQIEIGHSV